MPLQKKKIFTKAPLPEYLRDDEEVFHCVITNEIFRDYEEFCERVILCNSMVWSCSLTGKSGLTYTEALESEEIAKKHLKDFPTELRIPVLFLASKTKRTAFGDMAEDVFMYTKDRYFIGENVEASFSSNKWRESHVLQVIAPSEEQIKTAPKNGQNTDRHSHLSASLYRYEVEHLDADDQDVSEIMMVDLNRIRRKKGLYTRDKNKLFLKQYVQQNDKGVWTIKESVLEDFGINKIKYDQIFDGPVPDFDPSKKLTKNISNGKKVKQDTLAKFLSKNNVMSSSQKNNLIEQMKKRELEYKQNKEEMKQKKAEEKLIEMQKRKEENVKVSMYLKDWYKPKEDLELEDQQRLPEPPSVQSKIPAKYLGDVLMIMEFVTSFSKLLSTKNFFPGGITLELLERALMEKEVAGPLTDLVQMLLITLFNVQDEEASQYKTQIEQTGIRQQEVDENLSLTKATHLATLASRWSIKYQGLPIGRLPLYSLTVSEILRLHLLSSGARINETGARWRYQQRGGYTSEDDPGLYLRLRQPHLLKSLAVHNIIQLSLGDKLKIITCLIDQLLTYADVRDVVEERLEKSRQAKQDLRSMHVLERKRERKYITAKMQLRKEAKENNKDMTAEFDKLLIESNKKQAEYERKMEKLMQATSGDQINLGYDRAFRRYLKLESIPGLFVEFDEENPGTCLPEVVKQNPELVGAGRTETILHIRKLYEELNTSDKENDPEKRPEKVNGSHIPLAIEDKDSQKDLLMCSADPRTCVVHSTKTDKNIWSFYHDPEQVNELIDRLNKRGVRESELQQMLHNERESLINLIEQTPAIQLNPNVVIVPNEQKVKLRKVPVKSKYEDANLGFPTDMDSSEVLQNALIDNILEIEEKIFAGNLGSLKVKDRNVWRENLCNKDFAQLDTTLLKYENSKLIDKVKKEGKSSRPNTPDIIPPTKEYVDPGKFLGNTVDLDTEYMDVDNDEPVFTQSEAEIVAIKSLSIALAQVAQAVDQKFLKKPLGHADINLKKKEEYDVLERWEQSLLASTSYSQIFLHYGSLDSCVMWSRSALLARCNVCRRQRDSDRMLICDNCNNGQHLYCLKPKLTSVPQGDWFCDKCKRQKEQEAKLQNPEPEPKKKRRIFREEISDDESKGEENDESSDEHEQEAEEEQEDVDEEEVGDEEKDDEDDVESAVSEVCNECGSGGTLICCDKCPGMYHLECVQPPLRRVPRGQWICHQHSNENKRDRKKQSDSSSDSEVTSQRRSNRREIETRDDLPLHNAPLQELLSDILKHKDAWPFIRPVQKNEVPDYYEVIAKPMDFGTIKYKLNMGEYKCDAELMADAVLVFDNCNMYNDCDADVYKCGVRLLKYFSKKSRSLGLKLPEEMDDEESMEHKPKKRRTK